MKDIFTKLAQYMEYEVHEDRLDMGKLTQSLTMKLNEAMTSVNPKVKTQEEEKDQESDKKLNNIEIELEEIA